VCLVFGPNILSALASLDGLPRWEADDPATSGVPIGFDYDISLLRWSTASMQVVHSCNCLATALPSLPGAPRCRGPGRRAILLQAPASKAQVGSPAPFQSAVSGDQCRRCQNHSGAVTAKRAKRPHPQTVRFWNRWCQTKRKSRSIHRMTSVDLAIAVSHLHGQQKR